MNKKSVTIALFALVGVVILGVVIYLTSGANKQRNREPDKQAEMLRITQEWARLAPLPKNISNYTIVTEGNPASRAFRASFVTNKEELEQWMKASPGFSDATITQQPDGRKKYIIKPGGGAQHAEVTIDEGIGNVDIYVYWS